MSNNKDQGIIGNFFLFLANKTDGKKTIYSILLIAGGAATVIFTPEYRDGGMSMLSAGVMGLIVGITHKFVKRGGDGKFR